MLRGAPLGAGFSIPASSPSALFHDLRIDPLGRGLQHLRIELVRVAI